MVPECLNERLVRRLWISYKSVDVFLVEIAKQAFPGGKFVIKKMHSLDFFTVPESSNPAEGFNPIVRECYFTRFVEPIWFS
jgi:hypothetical protein